MKTPVKSMFLTTAGNGSAQKANSIENRRCQQGTACFCVLTNAADREKSAAFFMSGYRKERGTMPNSVFFGGFLFFIGRP
jgi:hypothetical protein